MRTREVIRNLKQARKIHADWVKYLQENPDIAKTSCQDPLEEVVGKADWHANWVTIYDETLKRLQ